MISNQSLSRRVITVHTVYRILRRILSIHITIDITNTRLTNVGKFYNVINITSYSLRIYRSDKASHTEEVVMKAVAIYTTCVSIKYIIGYLKPTLCVQRLVLMAFALMRP